MLPPASIVAGPVQLVASESPAGFRAAVELVAADPAVDAVIAIFVEHIATGAYEAAAALAAAAPELHAAGIPLLTVFMTPGPLPEILREGAGPPRRRRGAARPSRCPRSARPRRPPARSGAPPRTGASARRRRWSPRGSTTSTATPRPRCSPARSPAAAGGCGPDEVAALLDAYGIGLVEQRRVGSVAAAAKAAAELGGPVALKGVAPGVVHKAQAGAVRLDLHGPTAVRRAAHEIAQRLEAAGTPAEDFLVQRMADAGVEMLVGVLADERFGPVVACGAGGGTAEVLEDVAVRLAPLALEEAREMIARPALAGAARARAGGRRRAGGHRRARRRAGGRASRDRRARPQPRDGRPGRRRGGRRARARRPAGRPARVPGGGAMKRIGLLGGMSWESTIEYYRLVNELVAKRLGGLHSADCLLRSVDFADIEVLQREDRWDEAGEILAAEARALEAAGAELLVLCTNTMHKLAPQITAAIGIPFVHIADTTADAVRAAGLTRVGLLATAYTMEQEFYVGRLREHGLEVVVPDAADRKIVHDVIYEELCVGIVRDESRDQYRRIMRALAADGAQGILLGCTEIDLLVGAEDSPVPVFDTTRLHAEKAVELSVAAPAARARTS